MTENCKDKTMASVGMVSFPLHLVTGHIDIFRQVSKIMGLVVLEANVAVNDNDVPSMVYFADSVLFDRVEFTHKRKDFKPQAYDILIEMDPETQDVKGVTVHKSSSSYGFQGMDNSIGDNVVTH